MAQNKTLEKYSTLELSFVCVGVDPRNTFSNNREAYNGHHHSIFNYHDYTTGWAVNRDFNR